MTPPSTNTSAPYDLIVVGAGPGGYVAAIRGAQLGMRVAVVEARHLGGVCLNWGCIPTKALLRSAEALHMMENAAAYGLACDNPRADLAAVVKRSRATAATLNGGVGHLLKKNKVDVIWGRATLTAPGALTVAAAKDAPAAPRGALGPGAYRAKHIVIATGARPRAIPGLDVDGARVWSHVEAMVPESLPKRLLVIGSGAIGVEFASFFTRMGAAVTVVEIAPQILPAEDADIAAHARKRFEKQGMTIFTGAKVAQLAAAGDGVRARIETADGSARDEAFDRAIVAVGAVGNIEGLGLEALGVATDRGTIVVDGLGRSNVPGIYAIGDVAGAPMLAHKAEHEGVACVEAIAGRADAHPIDRAKIPGCTYCDPQIASVGLTEAAARAAGRAVKIGRFPFAGNGKALALGEAEGLVKTVFDRDSGELLGAHMIGAEVTELIQGFVVAMTLETTEADLHRVVFPHPTLSEMMHESALAADNRAIHI